MNFSSLGSKFKLKFKTLQVSEHRSQDLLKIFSISFGTMLDCSVYIIPLLCILNEVKIGLVYMN
jgi:hypothetical protein